MDHIKGMDLHDGAAEGTDTGHHLPVVHPAFPSDLIPQGHPFDVFHHNIGSSVLLKVIPDCYDPFSVFFIQHGKDPGLPQKTAAAGGEQALFPTGRQHPAAFPVPQRHSLQEKLFHRHPNLQLQVQSQISNSETAPAQDPSGQISAGQKSARRQAVSLRSPQRRIITAEFTGPGRIGPFFHTARTYFLIIHFFPLLFCHMRITPFFFRSFHRRHPIIMQRVLPRQLLSFRFYSSRRQPVNRQRILPRQLLTFRFHFSNCQPIRRPLLTICFH